MILIYRTKKESVPSYFETLCWPNGLMAIVIDTFIHETSMLCCWKTVGMPPDWYNWIRVDTCQYVIYLDIPLFIIEIRHLR